MDWGRDKEEKGRGRGRGKKQSGRPERFFVLIKSQKLRAEREKEEKRRECDLLFRENEERKLYKKGNKAF